MYAFSLVILFVSISLCCQQSVNSPLFHESQSVTQSVRERLNPVGQPASCEG